MTRASTDPSSALPGGARARAVVDSLVVTDALSRWLGITVLEAAAVHPGDVLTATAAEESITNLLSCCAVTVRNQHDVIVAHVRGTVRRTARRHQLPTPD